MAKKTSKKESRDSNGTVHIKPIKEPEPKKTTNPGFKPAIFTDTVEGLEDGTKEDNSRTEMQSGDSDWPEREDLYDPRFPADCGPECDHCKGNAPVSEENLSYGDEMEEAPSWPSLQPDQLS